MAKKKSFQPPPTCFAFTWPRPVKRSGFQWRQEAAGEWLLIAPPEQELVEYEPLQTEPGLFLTFARLDDAKDAFLRFANLYGRLGTYMQLGPERAEPLSAWRDYYLWLRFLTNLREECSKAQPNLADVVGWEGDQVIYQFPKIGVNRGEMWRHFGWCALKPCDKKNQPLFQPGDLLGPARWFLGYSINAMLKQEEGLRRPVAPEVIWSQEEKRPHMVFGPSTLIGAMIC